MLLQASPTVDTADALGALSAAASECSTHPENETNWDNLRRARREAAEAILRLPKRAARGPETITALALIKQLATAGDQERLAMEARLWLQSLDARDWRVLLAAMVLTSACEWRQAPPLSEVPDWLWGDYAAWLFAAPTTSCEAGEFDSYLEQTARPLEELSRWMRRNSGSAAVRAAVDAYLAVAGQLPWHLATKSVRSYAELRGRFLTHVYGQRLPIVTQSFPAPRVGRRLRVGFVQRCFGPGADLRRVQASYEYLDTRAFETILLSLSADDETFAKSRGTEEPRVVIMAGDFAAQIAALRSMALDVVVYCGDAGGQLGEDARFASQRVAPLQVAHDGHGVTTGFPAIDLYVMRDRPDAAKIAGEFTERLGLLRGSANVFTIPLGPREGLAETTRASLGLPADAVLFFSVVSVRGVSGEMLGTWAKVLARVPGARLALVHVAPAKAEDDTAVQRFGERLSRVFQPHGVAADRVSLFPVGAAGAEHVRALLALADVYLDAAAGGDLVWPAEAVALGRPVVTLAPGAALKSAATSEMLAAIGAAELIAPDTDAYVARAALLANDPEQRGALCIRLQDAVEANPAFLDGLAASEAFGALLETAFDELTALGTAQFQAQREPLRCFAPPDVAGTIAAGEEALAAGDGEAAGHEATLALRAEPANAAARILRGRALLAEGDAARAITYLLAAVSSGSGDAGVWLTLATALRQNSQAKEAIHALETSLRLDRSSVDAWLMLLDMAESAGVPELAGDARTVLGELAPDDPRVLALA